MPYFSLVTLSTADRTPRRCCTTFRTCRIIIFFRNIVILHFSSQIGDIAAHEIQVKLLQCFLLRKHVKLLIIEKFESNKIHKNCQNVRKIFVETPSTKEKDVRKVEKKSHLDENKKLVLLGFPSFFFVLFLFVCLIFRATTGQTSHEMTNLNFRDWVHYYSGEIFCEETRQKNPKKPKFILDGPEEY